MAAGSDATPEPSAGRTTPGSDGRRRLRCENGFARDRDPVRRTGPAGLVVEAVLAEVDHRLFVFLVSADAGRLDLEEVHRVVAGGHRVADDAFQPAEG